MAGSFDTSINRLTIFDRLDQHASQFEGKDDSLLSRIKVATASRANTASTHAANVNPASVKGGTQSGPAEPVSKIDQSKVKGLWKASTYSNVNLGKLAKPYLLSENSRLEKRLDKGNRRAALQERLLDGYQPALLDKPLANRGEPKGLHSNTASTLSNTAWASAIGDRPSNEDAHLATTIRFRVGESEIKADLTGVFDGHGGAEVSQYVADNIAKVLVSNLETFNQESLTQVGVYNALRETMVELHHSDAVTSQNKFSGGTLKSVGTTVNVGLKIENKLFIANVGDSRAVLVEHQQGSNPSIRQLTEDQNVDLDYNLKSQTGVSDPSAEIDSRGDSSKIGNGYEITSRFQSIGDTV